MLDKLSDGSLYDNAPLRLFLEISYVGTCSHNFDANRARVSGSKSSKPGSAVTLDVPGVSSKIVWIASKNLKAGAEVVICSGPEQDVSHLRGLPDSRVELNLPFPATFPGPEIRIMVPVWVDALGRDVEIDAFEVGD